MPVNKGRRLKQYVKIVCLYCGKEIELQPSRAYDRKIGKPRQFCNVTCAARFIQSRKKELWDIQTCPVCKKEFSVRPYKKQKCCCWDCRIKHRAYLKGIKHGEEHVSWRGNRVKRRRWYNRKIYLDWAKAVKQRDGYVCRKCGNIKYVLAHHVIPWEEDESKRFDVDNGLTLCLSCHQKHHLGVEDANMPTVQSQENYSLALRG